MTLYQSLFVIGLLIAASAFFSVSEISLAASRRLRLRQMADDGDLQAERVLRIQEQPGDYFTVVQIGQNAVAILGGIVGEGALSPHFNEFSASNKPFTHVRSAQVAINLVAKTVRLPEGP